MCGGAGEFGQRNLKKTPQKSFPFLRDNELKQFFFLSLKCTLTDKSRRTANIREEEGF